jgi:hypothetical protein
MTKIQITDDFKFSRMMSQVCTWDTGWWSWLPNAHLQHVAEVLAQVQNLGGQVWIDGVLMKKPKKGKKP